MSCPPPSFADLGSSARDLGDYGFCAPGFLGIDVRTRSSTGVETGAKGTHDVVSGEAKADLATAWTSKNGKTSLSNKWNSDKILETGVHLENHLLDGLKVCQSLPTGALGKGRPGRPGTSLMSDCK